MKYLDVKKYGIIRRKEKVEDGERREETNPYQMLDVVKEWGVLEPKHKTYSLEDLFFIQYSKTHTL